MSLGQSPLLVKHGLVGSGTTILALRIISVGLHFVVGIVLARTLTLTAFGIVVQVLAAATTVGTIMSLGTPHLITRELAGHYMQGKARLMKGVAHWALRIITRSWMVVSLVCVITLAVLAPPAWKGPGTLGLILAILLTLNLYVAAVLRGLSKVITAEIPEAFIQPFAILLMLATSSHFMLHPTAEWALGISVIGATFAACWGILALLRWLPSTLRSIQPTERPLEWGRATIIFFAISAFSTADAHLAVLMTGALAGSEAAGFFQVANRLAALTAMGLIAVNAPLMPKLAGFWSSENLQESRVIVHRTAKVGLAIAFVISIPLLIAPGSLLGIFGEPFREAHATLRILAVGQLVNAAFGPCGVVLMMTGHQLKALQALIVSVMASAITGVVLIPMLGHVGAAVAVTSALIVWNSLMSHWAWRIARINTIAVWGTREHQ